MPKSIGTLYSESRLIAKTINRITVEPERVELNDWRAEAKLLASSGGSCLSSTTLLVKGKHVPTYGFDGRCYGFLFDAEKCNVYDVSPNDSNSNRETKLAKRKERAGVDLLKSNAVGAKTFEELAGEVGQQDGQMNEVLLDAWKSSCVGLFVRKIDLDSQNPRALKHYYQSLLEIALIRKYLVQAFNYPEDFKICQYDERAGRLLTFPSMEELIVYARMQGVNDKTFPELFRLLDDKHHFEPMPEPTKVGEFLAARDLSPSLQTEVVAKLVKDYVPFDGRALDATSILLEVVDNIAGIAESTICDVITECQEKERIGASAQALRTKSIFAEESSTPSAEGLKDEDLRPTL